MVTHTNAWFSNEYTRKSPSTWAGKPSITMPSGPLIGPRTSWKVGSNTKAISMTTT